MTFEHLSSSKSPGRTNDLKDGLFTCKCKGPGNDKTTWDTAIVHVINYTCTFPAIPCLKGLLNLHVRE